MDPILEHIMLTGYPSKDYLVYELQSEKQLAYGPYDDFRDFLLEEKINDMEE